MRKLLRIKQSDLCSFNKYVMSFHQKCNNNFFQTPFTKLSINVEKLADQLFVFCKFDVLFSRKLPPILVVSFQQGCDHIDVYNTFKIPKDMVFELLLFIVLPQFLAIFIGMEFSRLFLFFFVTFFYLSYYLIISYFVITKMNTVLNLIRNYKSESN